MTMSDKRMQKAINTLKDSGVRITPQRHAVLEHLLTSMEHPTADEIYKALEHRFPNMSVATDYNNLRVLRQIGLVRELTFGNDSSRVASNNQDHYHVTCNKCCKIIEFDYT